jgi:uncharacterized protein (TIGR00369 family)
MLANTGDLEADGWIPHDDDTYIGGMGTVVERRRNGRIEIGLQTEERHKNLSGIVHGGVVMALLDRTIGINCREAAAGERMATASLTVNFARAIKVGDFIRISCDLKKTGRKAIFANAEAFVGNKVVATATGIWMRT